MRTMKAIRKTMMLLMAVLFLTACATAEERAARQAENLKMVKESVGSQKYRIDVTQMTPMRGTSHYVTARHLTINGNEVDCSLPYVGRDDIPHLKTRGEIRMDSRIEFKGEIQNYVLQLLPKKQSGVVTFTTKYEGDDLKFTITIDNSGQARIHLVQESRDYIDYEGTVRAIN